MDLLNTENFCGSLQWTHEKIGIGLELKVVCASSMFTPLLTTPSEGV